MHAPLDTLKSYLSKRAKYERSRSNFMANSLDQLDLSNIIGPYFNLGGPSACSTMRSNTAEQNTC